MVYLFVPSINMESLMNGTQSGKTFVFLYLMMALGAVIFLQAFVFNKTNYVRIGLPDLFLTIWCLYSILNGALKHVPLSSRLFEFFGLAILYLALRQIQGKYLIWLFVAVILGGAIQAVYGNLQLWGYYPSHHGMFKMTGSFFNPGPYAGYLAAVFPIALGLYLNKSLNVRLFERLNGGSANPLIVSVVSIVKRVSVALKALNVSTVSVVKRVSVVSYLLNNRNNRNNRNPSNLSNSEASNIQTPLWQSIIHLIAIATIISILLVLPASRSRAAWLAVAVSSFYLISVRYRLYSRAKAYFDTLTKKISLLVFSIIVLTIAGAGLYLMKKGSADGRMLIWKVSMNMIKERPVLGYGFDQFKANYMDYQAAYFEQNPDSEDAMVAGDNNYAFNEPILSMVENGLIGILLLVAVFLSVFLGHDKIRLTKETEERCTTSNNISLPIQSDQILIEENKRNCYLLPISRAVILSVLVFGLFSYPSQILPIKICLVFALAIAARIFDRKVNTERFQTIFPKPVQFALKSILTVLTIGLLWLATEQIHLIQTACSDWKNAFDLYNLGLYKDCLDDYKKAYPVLKNNGDFLTNYGKALSMAGKHPEAVDVLQQAAKHYPNTVVFTALGDSYKKLGQIEQAEQAYLHAWQMNPSRFYPKYLLAKLYDETGQHEKSVATAKELLGKEVKIESTAVKEIQEEMRKIIEKQDSVQNKF
jgi:tetratricopeptide (TPR) repeat protein